MKSTKRKREKLTRAQLNRRTARNIASFKESRKREQKALLKSLDSLPHVIKSIEVEEKRIEDMKAIREVSHNQLQTIHFPYLSFGNETNPFISINLVF